MELFCFASAAILLITQKEVEDGLISGTAAGNGAFVKFEKTLFRDLLFKFFV